MEVMLWVLIVLAAFSGLGVVFSPQTIYSALSLVLTVGLLAVIFLVLNAQFLFAVQLIVYAGAVMVLFVFIIALLDPSSEERPRFLDPHFILGTLAIAGICAAVFIAAHNGTTYNLDCSTPNPGCMRGAQVGSAASPQDTRADPYKSFAFAPDEVNQPGNGNIQTVGNQLFRTYVLPFEITSLLLLVAAIGAVYLTRAGGPSRRKSIDLGRRPPRTGNASEETAPLESIGSER